MKKELIKTLQEKLEQEKISIEKELGSFAKEDKTQKDNWKTQYPNREVGNLEEEADEAQEYDTLVSIEQNLETRLKDINLALEKIEKGNYGVCENCKKEIEQERLTALPEARFCIACNKQV